MQYEEIAALLPDYLDGKLTDRQNQQIHEAIQASDQLQVSLLSLEDLRSAKSHWVDEDTPDWHRTAFAARVRQKPIEWMNWFSFATSVAAIFLVMFRVQFISNSDGYQINFGEQFDKVTVQRQMNQHLDDWQAEQVSYLDHRFLEFENKQLVQSQQVLTAALQYNRDERRQDLNQLTSYFVDQRSIDIKRSKNRYQKITDSQLQDREDIKTIYASIQK